MASTPSDQQVNAVTGPTVSFSGETLQALEGWLLECRYTDRSGDNYFLLTDTHNEVRSALGKTAMPVHPDFKSGYKTYKAEQQATQPPIE